MDDLPGSDGEHAEQVELGSRERARSFYDESHYDHLTSRMRSFVEARIMFFLSTADSDGHTDCSPRIGPEGFVTVLDEETLAYPEYRGNGVHASLGNIRENPHASLLFVDWWETGVGLHVNGRATVHDDLDGAVDPTGGDRRKRWVELAVDEAYIQCAKHMPTLSIEEFDPPWGTDDDDAKRSGFFDVR
ncbi:pyridoxamine 5'-phosphate oxidase family protein [Halolamina salifodinae]|uniref:Putative pyridoxine 5'-phosphate oxidase superfamily flavin-nucleotide-binding protein n=1 Tax=Halolamina salifodinae TaxID=1202767 RepID=A0A8T4H250_9EURY|nr:pyridoxamine 5'-phosphate oxidase family protein [Halolamina salifodinae]MBP1987695.1 putative pyridoxine 5'-phosphate oxidase superfamily flavin-nucleotide-binding protein [Halolamina salifodinae]